MLVDSHCHLDRLDLSPYQGDLGAAIAAARDVGVERLLCVGINMANAESMIAIARAHQGVYASVGIHPMDVVGNENCWKQLAILAEAPEVVAIGETGLDYHYSEDTADSQQESFRRHLHLAAQIQKPVIVHTRQARKETIAIIREAAAYSPRGVLHCFTEDWSMAKLALDLGFYISFSGIVTFANAAQLREVVKKVPMDRLLIETDSPYLAPVPYRGNSNEPRYLPEVASCIAEIKGLNIDKIVEFTSTNFDNLFFLK